MTGLAFVGIRLVAALAIVQYISLFFWGGRLSGFVGFVIIAAVCLIWRYTGRVAMGLSGGTNVESWAYAWGECVVGLYGIYLLVWQIPVLVVRNSVGIWIVLTQSDGEFYWFLGNPAFFVTLCVAIFYVLGPDRVCRVVRDAVVSDIKEAAS